VIETTSLFAEIHCLLERPADSGGHGRDAVELTLTNGYAHALQLEGRRLRIEDELRAVVRGEASGESERLAGDLEVVDEELAHLRSLLSTLKAHALT
jgi:hypothetical protein